MRRRDPAERARDLRREIPGHFSPGKPALRRVASVTAGLKCAPEIGPNVRISATSMAPGRQRVGKQRDRDVSTRERSPIMPEPTTAASSNAVPSPSAASFAAVVIR